MKIIDERGKLFGLINIIDLAVIVIVALVVVGGYARFKDKPIIVDETSKALITYEVSEVRQATIDNIVVGDKLQHYDRGGHVGIIKEVSYQPYTEPLEYEGEWVDAEIPGKFDVYLVVEADINNSPDVVVVGGEQTRVGVQYRMKNKRIAFFGTVLDVNILD